MHSTAVESITRTMILEQVASPEPGGPSARWGVHFWRASTFGRCTKVNCAGVHPLLVDTRQKRVVYRVSGRHERFPRGNNSRYGSFVHLPNSERKITFPGLGSRRAGRVRLCRRDSQDLAAGLGRGRRGAARVPRHPLGTLRPDYLPRSVPGPSGDFHSSFRIWLRTFLCTSVSLFSMQMRLGTLRPDHLPRTVSGDRISLCAMSARAHLFFFQNLVAKNSTSKFSRLACSIPAFV